MLLKERKENFYNKSRKKFGVKREHWKKAQ